MSKIELNKNGYEQFKDSKILVHRYNAMKKYGLTREQLKKYDVHHIDGNKLNNNQNNLVILKHNDHMIIETHLRVIKNRTIISLVIIALSLVMNVAFTLIRKNQYIYISIILLIAGIYLNSLPYSKLRKLLFNFKILSKHKK